MQPRSLAISSSLLLCGLLPAQLSGTLVVDPAGTGTGSYRSLTAAINALFVNGLAGPVEIVMLPGTYTESVLLPPLPGTATFPVTIRAAAGPGTVQLAGSGGDTIAMIGVSFLHNRGLRFDGLDFVGAPGHAISGTQFCEDVEIRNCTFGPSHRSTATGEFRHALIVSENSGNEVGWRVHHNRFTVPNHTTRTSYGIYLSNGGDWDVHDNTWDLNSCDYGLYLINNNRRLDRIWNNLFTGLLNSSTSSSMNSVCVIRVDISNYDNDIAHNTFLVTIPSSGCLIAAGGISGSTPATNRIRGNIFVLTGSGACIVASATAPLAIDGNCYWCPGGEIGRLGASTPGYTTLATWQAASLQDAGSAQADPMFRNAVTAPFDLRPVSGSVVEGLAVQTPAYVLTDFAGRLRDAAPDAGAYESTSFAIYGQGCAGSGGLVPAMGHSGAVALGSTTFTIELSQAPPTALVLIVGGLSRTVSGSTPLPFQLGGGCAVQAAPDAVRSGLTTASGTASLLLPIPNAPALMGTDLYFQWIVVDQAGAPNSLGVTVSDAGALQI
jgi:hypothetical protein